MQLLKKRYRITLDFELTADDNAIVSSLSDDDVKRWDLALLQQFVKDSDAVRHLAVEYIALDMGFWTPEDVEGHLGVGDKDRQETFKPSIALLPDDVREAWQEMQNDPEIDFEWCLEGVTDCFETTLVDSKIEEIKEQDNGQQ
jgi:hypothetical protein